MADSLVLGGRSTRRPVDFALLNAVQDKNSMAGVPRAAIWFGLTEGLTAKFDKSEM
jgi:hypothetical protein